MYSFLSFLHFDDTSNGILMVFSFLSVHHFNDTSNNILIVFSFLSLQHFDITANGILVMNRCLKFLFSSVLIFIEGHLKLSVVPPEP